LEIEYLLQFWVIVHACQLGIRSNILDHHGELLAQNGAMVELQWVLELANMSTNQSKKL
jgi:hypothetical protein